MLHVVRAREIAIKMTIARGPWYVELTTAKTLILLKTQGRIAALVFKPLILILETLVVVVEQEVDIMLNESACVAQSSGPPLKYLNINKFGLNVLQLTLPKKAGIMYTR